MSLVAKTLFSDARKNALEVEALRVSVVIIRLTLCSSRRTNARTIMNCDICIYGGTAAGVIAAMAAAKAGRSVILIEQGRHLGGMTSGGLGFTDIGNKLAIGGLSRDFYRRIGKVYGKEEAWTLRAARRGIGPQRFDRPSQRQRPQDSGAAQPSDRRSGRARRAAPPNHGREGADRWGNAPGHPDHIEEHIPIAAQFFIDCGYEGDLMAAAKVSYTVGREAVAKYGEPLNGIRPETPKHQFWRAGGSLPQAGRCRAVACPADPGRRRRNAGRRRPSRADLQLPALSDAGQSKMASDPQHGRPRPGAIRAAGAAIWRRWSIAKKPITLGMLLKIDRLPNGKTDINNNGAVSTDYIGNNYAYPEGDYATRDRIWHEHLSYTQGLLHFLANDASRAGTHSKGNVELVALHR